MSNEPIIGQDAGDNGQDKPQEQKQLELHILWKANGMAISGCVKNEMAALYMLEKGKDMIKQINRPQIAQAKIMPKKGIMDFVRRRH